MSEEQAPLDPLLHDMEPVLRSDETADRGQWTDVPAGSPGSTADPELPPNPDIPPTPPTPPPDIPDLPPEDPQRPGRPEPVT